jgi:hypothetical protein
MAGLLSSLWKKNLDENWCKNEKDAESKLSASQKQTFDSQNATKRAS